MLVRIDRRPDGPATAADPERLFALVRAGFGQRRKMLRRSLAGLVDAGGLRRRRRRADGPGRGARRRRLGPAGGGGAVTTRARAGEGDAVAAGHRRAGRRLPLIDAEMVTVDLADELDVRRRRRPRGRRRAGGGLPRPAGDDNLVRAGAGAPSAARAAVGCTKRIPAGAGLGGGSADAAAVLRWAGCRRPRRSPPRSAPTCRSASSAAGPGCTGIGEVVEPLPFEDRTFTLLTPPFGCSTPAVYRAWDDLGGPTADGPNDLEPAALVVEPRLAEWRDRLGDATGRTPRAGRQRLDVVRRGRVPRRRRTARVVVRRVPSDRAARALTRRASATRSAG